MDMYHSNTWIDVNTPKQLADVGAQGLQPPPANIHPRGLGFTFAMWINMSSIQNFGLSTYYAPMYKQIVNYTLVAGSDRFLARANISLGMRQNYSLEFVYDSCRLLFSTANALQTFQWQHVAITMSEAGVARLTMNGMQMANPAVCGSAPLATFLNPQTEYVRMGPNASATVGSWESPYYGCRLEIAAVHFYSRALIPEEIVVAAMNPPRSIASIALQLRAVSLPPVSLMRGQVYTFSVFPPSWFGSNVTLYIAASRGRSAGIFPATEDTTDWPDVLSLNPFAAQPDTAVTQITFCPRCVPAILPPMTGANVWSPIRTAKIQWPSAYSDSDCVDFATFIVGQWRHPSRPFATMCALLKCSPLSRSLCSVVFLCAVARRR